MKIASLVLVITLLPSLPAAAGGQAGAPLVQHAELTRLDGLLASGDDAAAARLLTSLEPQIAKSDRLAFDAIYVLVGRNRIDLARAQWNGLAPRLQDKLRADAAAAPTPAARQRLGEALFTQGLLTVQGGDAKEAIGYLKQADGLGFPALDSPLMLLAAGALLDLREYDLAVGAYRAYLEHHKANTAARAALGAALYSTGKILDARKELDAVLRVAPKTPRANYTMGVVLFELKEYGEARAHLERELALDQRCSPCASRLAHIAYLEGDEAACEGWLAKGLALDAMDVESRLVSGMLALRRGQYDAAIEHLSRVVERSPEFATGRFQLATAYRRAGQIDKAREQLAVYQKLIKEQKDREIGVRGSQ